jgi:DNA repair protein RadC
MQVTIRELIHEYPAHEGPKFSTADDVAIESRFISDASKEFMVAFYLDTKNRVIAREIVSVGILNASLIHPREVFRSAIHCNAHAIVLVHNHPSGSAEPSQQDKEVTQLLCKAGEIIGIELLDHVIVAGSNVTSLKEQGTLNTAVKA